MGTHRNRGVKPMTKATPQQPITFEDINQLIWRHLEDRDWHRNPSRGLAVSIALEAGELLEHYQWREEPVGDNAAIAEELADIFIYAFSFAQVNSIDIAEAIKQKLAKAERKFPAAEFKHKNAQEREAARIQAKLRHQKKGL